jgi:hypothetical protein
LFYFTLIMYFVKLK